MNDSLLEPLLSSPMLPEHVEELNRVLATEHARRRKFYEEMSEQGSWEFVNGAVIRGEPQTNAHNRIALRIMNLAGVWVEQWNLGIVSGLKTLCQFPRNDYEPDIVFFGKAKAALIQPNTLLHPIPDFVVEVLSESTEANDRGVKLMDYEAHGVQEYWIVDAANESVEQCHLEGARYTKKLHSTGQISSQAVAGFEIFVRAIFDDASNLSELRRLLEANR